MNILITGAAGFLGKNLTAALHNISSGKDRTHPQLPIDEIFVYDADSAPALLEEYCAKADFVFHLAGVNRPTDPEAFMRDNCNFTGAVVSALKKHKNPCPVMFSSSIHAAGESDYGRSKRAAENLLFDYAQKTGAKVLVYRLPNVFGKWCKPEYNSAIATFCHHIANGLPITVQDRDTPLTLLYIDDFVHEMLLALEGKETRCSQDNRYCAAPITHQTTLGEVVDLLIRFHEQPNTRMLPAIPQGSLAGKLYSTYLSYLPKEKIAFPLAMKKDARGSFTELLKTEACGQFSVNIVKPHATKGEHWHHSKWEFFFVVSGEGRIRQRRIGTDEVLEFSVSGEKIQAVHMLPGYTHSITNVSDSENLVTVMWASEPFDPAHPDTYYEEV